MMGTIALILAVGAAGLVLIRAGKGRSGSDKRSVLILKIVVWLGLAAALLAAKLTPLALMVLVAAGGVTAIEIWRERAIRSEGPPAGAPAPVVRPSSREEAAAVLGVALDASEEEIRAAHRRLIGQLHPDKGGSDYLAAKINEARRLLLAARQPAPDAPTQSSNE
jgi:hypothetical protein